MQAAHEKYTAKLWYGSSHFWALNKLSNLSNDISVLDVGPGSGVMGDFLKKQGNLNLSAIEVDPLTRETLKDTYKKIEPSLDNFSNDKFDFVLLLDVLEHMTWPDTFLSSLKNNLNPGARILISVPSFTHWSIRLAILFGYFDYHNRGILDRTHFRFFSKRSLYNLIKSKNFQIISSSASIVPLELLISKKFSEHSWFLKFSKIRHKLAEIFPSFFAYQYLVEIKYEIN